MRKKLNFAKMQVYEKLQNSQENFLEIAQKSIGNILLKCTNKNIAKAV